MQGKIEELLLARKSTWSRSHRETNRWHLEHFARWLQDHQLQHGQLSERQLETYLGDHGWAPSTRHGALCAIKAFYRFTLGEALSPAEGLKVRRPRPRPQRTLTAKELEQVLVCFDTGTDKGVRDLAIVTLLLDTGLRSAELCRLKVDDTSIHTRKLRVIVKGGEWSHRVFGQYAASCIASWLAIRPRFAWPDVEQVFVGIGGRTRGHRMTTTGLRAEFYKLADRAGVEKFSPHAFRRSFATQALRNGAPTRMVQIAGAWKDLEMVERYTLVLEADDFRWFPTDHLMGVAESKSGRESR
jgi:integrase/recombinase XerD